MALLLHYTGQDYISRGLLNTELTPGSTSAIVGGCKTGKGFAFDETFNSVFEINGITDTEKFSIDFWYYTGANVTAPQSIFSDYSQLNGRINIRVRDGSFEALVYNTSNVYTQIGSNGIVINTWYHVAVTVDTIGNISIYLNGVFQRQSAITGTVRSSIGLYVIGKRHTNGHLLLNGTKICNFKLYNHVLSAREIAEDYKSLMLHYKLDKPITTKVFDYSGFNRHIAVIENTTTNSTTEKRVYGGSLANDGTKSLYGRIDLSVLDGATELTFACRFRILTNTPHCFFACRSGFSGAGIAFYKELPDKTFSFDMGVRSTVNMTDTFVYGNWYDFVGVKDATTIKSYINGKLVTTLNTTAPLSLMGQHAAISCSISDSSLTPAYPMKGNVQDIRFYAKALTQEDVTELYQTRHMVDKDSNCYTYELIEGQATVGMNKQGQLLCDEIIENEDGVFQIMSNKTIKTKEFKEI